MAEVLLEDVGKVYAGRINALRDVTLRVADGELLALVGPSGCGKTTLLRLIAGLETPTSGSIRLGGKDVRGLPPRARDVAMVFQDDALYPHMTVQKNLGFALRLRRVPRRQVRQKVQAIADLLDLADLLGRHPGALSGGQRQRVALGRVLVRDPGCALLDEPLSDLDTHLRRQLRREIKAVHQRVGMTTIYVTHDQEEAMTLGDRVAVMAAGEILQVGPPSEVHDHPANRFVAGFIGDPPMNFIEGRREGDGRRIFFDDGHGLRVPLPEALARAAGPDLDRRVVLGVRPQRMRLVDPQAANPARDALTLRVRLVEPLGERVDLSLETDQGTRLIARVGGGTRVRCGQKVRLAVDPAGVHLFEPGPMGPHMMPGSD